MYCHNCGKEIDDRAVICVHCHTQVRDIPGTEPVMNEKLGCILSLVCFFFPLIGLILYFIYKPQSPQKSKQAGMIALISFGIQVLSNILYFAFFFGMQSVF